MYTIKQKNKAVEAYVIDSSIIFELDGNVWAEESYTSEEEAEERFQSMILSNEWQIKNI